MKDTKDSIVKYLVDDDESFRVIVDAIFKQNNITNYKIFSDFTELKDTLQEKILPEVLILDYYVKDETAFDLISYIKKICPHCHLIIMSGAITIKILVEIINTHMRLSFVDKSEKDFKGKLIFYINETCDEILECRKQEEERRKTLIQEWEKKRESFHKLKFHPVDEK